MKLCSKDKVSSFIQTEIMTTLVFVDLIWETIGKSEKNLTYRPQNPRISVYVHDIDLKISENV